MQHQQRRNDDIEVLVTLLFVVALWNGFKPAIYIIDWIVNIELYVVDLVMYHTGIADWFCWLVGDYMECFPERRIVGYSNGRLLISHPT